MEQRRFACHLAEITRSYKGKVYRCFLLRRTYRDNGRVKHQTLGNLSHLPTATIEVIRRSLQGEPLVAPHDAFEIVRSRPHGHVVAILGTLRRLGLDRLIASQRTRKRDLIEALIVARILDPTSKLATARSLQAETLHSSLGEVLGVQDVDEDELYQAMDWLLPRQGRIEKALAKRHLTNGSLVLCDVTSTYFEGRTCPLAKRGHNRDGKKGKLQIVIALLCNSEGCPVAEQVFEGNTGDPKTLSPQIQKLRQQFGLERLVVVGDRGLITSARIEKDLKTSVGLDWITALRAPAIRKLVKERLLQMSLFDQKDLAEIASPDFPGERLVACKNPFLAEERARKRGELLEATERELAKIAAATRRAKRPLRGRTKIALRVGAVIGRFKMRKHFCIRIQNRRLHFWRNQKRIDAEVALDGVYVIRTCVAKKKLTSDEAVRSYKSLATVERAYRSLKTVDLHVRPIHHRKADRVRAHVFICTLAYYVEWHLRGALAPIMFQDDDRAAGEALRDSVVAPAQRSPRALDKASSKRTEDGAPVHSFQTLLRDLATIVRNRVRPKATAATEFDVVTTPTALQQRALDLLKVPLTM